jgi:hypothetical protein
MDHTTTIKDVDLEWLFKLRVVIARCGEMDLARWWNSNKQLGSAGASVLKRGFPRTHHFAQARCVTALAEQRCAQLLGHDRVFTLWRLPDAVEDGVEGHWDAWIDQASGWQLFFESVGALTDRDPSKVLHAFGLVTADEANAGASLKPNGKERGVSVAESFSGSRREIALLALGFAAGAVNDPVVPYIPGRAT